MAERKSVRIKIFGTEYVLKGDSEPEYMQELAQAVDQKMREHGSPGSVQVNRIAILTAFQFADELMKARRILDGERQTQAQSSRQLAQLDIKIQEALQDSSPSSAPLPVLTMEIADSEEIPPLEEKASQAAPAPEDTDLNWK